MTKKEFQEKYNFSDCDMERISLALSISDGKITEIFNEKLKYQNIKIVIKKT